MPRVEYDAKTQEWVHLDTGRTIPASDIRNLPHHRRQVLAIMGEQNPEIPDVASADPRVRDSQGTRLPIENETQAEMIYVERILGDGNA